MGAHDDGHGAQLFQLRGPETVQGLELHGESGLPCLLDEGAELAVDQANAAGGIDGRKVELVVYDDQAKPDQAVPIANKLIGRDGVKIGISGSYSGATRAAANVYQGAGIPFISAYAVHPDITRAGSFVFRTSFVGEVQGRAGAKLIGESLGKKRVSLITLQNDFGKSLAAGFKEAAGQFGIEVISEYQYSIKDRQFGPVIAKVKADDPEAIYASGYFFTAGPLVKQLRGAGVAVPVIGQEGYDSEKFIEIAGEAAEGIIITTSLDRDSESPEARDFIAAFEKRAGFKTDMVEYSEGEEAGVKSATFTADGTYAYGYLKAEVGIHRLVRISPFDAQKRRHTAFASVFVSPEVDDDIEIDIKKEDVREDTYRASGKGGQHVNKTSSAVRLTHIESGLVAQCQNERSQHKNRATAMKQLQAKLYEMEMQKRRGEQQKLEDSKADIGWGSQIRSYVLDQSRIKDLRTGVETGNTQAVLDGELDQFIEASLKQGL